jgi:hypothetical protein
MTAGQSSHYSPHMDDAFGYDIQISGLENRALTDGLIGARNADAAVVAAGSRCSPETRV